ncbi:VanW family protein [Heliorestis convoluta]|uniref:VanW family protein, putative n=1 Tax=Heliorestis convoluta TaxID=356322 RepID=A0A5Q2N1H5_9FIRM|nr:VanW family protein [Heliorestis convoluta]QGG48667.1 VanW family protein, putative [Heliorestis convoluta]
MSLPIYFRKVIIGFYFLLLSFFLPSPLYAYEVVISSIDLPVPADSGLHNAKKAAEYINGTIVKPGETFSFNQVVGRRTVERGFVRGGVFSYVNGQWVTVQGLGGGICRTSTALHQAVEQADLQIIERHLHTVPVSYAPRGTDATVYWGILDYKFRNNKENPIHINMASRDNILKVRLYERLHQEAPFPITVNERLLSFSFSPLLIQNKTMVPLHSFAEQIEAQLIYLPESNLVTLQYGEQKITIDMAVSKLEKDENSIILEPAVRSLNNHIMVPLRDLIVALGGEIDWNETSRSITIYLSTPEDKSALELESESKPELEPALHFEPESASAPEEEEVEWRERDDLEQSFRLEEVFDQNGSTLFDFHEQ